MTTKLPTVFSLFLDADDLEALLLGDSIEFEADGENTIELSLGSAFDKKLLEDTIDVAEWALDEGPPLLH